MATVTQSIAVQAPAEVVFDIVSDFAHYPDFLAEIIRADVVSKSATKATVAFSANVIKRIDYTMVFELKRPREIRWTMVDGDALIRSNDGWWKFEALEKNLTDLTFSCEMHFNIWLPKSIAEGVITSHLPVMMKNFKVRAEQGCAEGQRANPSPKPVARKKRASASKGKKCR